MSSILIEGQDHRVRVSIFQVLIQRLILARHYWSFRSNRRPTTHNPAHETDTAVPQHSVGAKGRSSISGNTSAAWLRPSQFSEANQVGAFFTRRSRFTLVRFESRWSDSSTDDVPITMSSVVRSRCSADDASWLRSLP